MLLILMYHRVYGLERMPAAFATHLRYLMDHHPLVLPGEHLASTEVSVCLTFDDATVDFYHQVFPLLQTLSGRALLAVPTAWIESRTEMPMEQRLALQNTAVEQHGGYETATAGLCTWEELQEMQASGHVCCAAHGHQHLDMSVPTTDVAQELKHSRAALHQHLGQIPTTFVYPYGRTNYTAQAQVKQCFPYAMRISSAINASWSGNNGLLYRIDAEKFWPDGRVWSLTDATHWRLKYLMNRLRNK